jgi:thiol-disulfide isomerase/thioredoxin
MKKTILLIAMATLCLFLRVNAQAPSNPKPQLGPVAIGQMMPELTLTRVHNFKSNTLNLADLEAKLIIIDFWATWCSPCVAMIPKIDQLQQKYHGDIQFISVSYQKEEEVVSFMKKLEERDHVAYQVPLITNDKTLNKLFPHTTLPHYVWIGANGVVKAITGMEDITADNIDKMLDHQTVNLKEKKETSIPYDSNKPFLIDRNGGDGKEMVYHSVLSGYVEGARNFERARKADGTHVNGLIIMNSPIIWLYKYAFGNGFATYFSDSKVAIEVRHPERLITNLSGMAYLDWLSKPGNGYCYELLLPKSLAPQFFQVMQDNLKLLFPQYTAQVERRKIKTMVLVRSHPVDLIKTLHPDGQRIEDFNAFGFTLQNSTINAFVHRVQLLYQQNSKVPFRNETGYSGKVDLAISANLSSVADMNKALKKYHLEWKEKYVRQNILVIRDSINHAQID